jgi:hypothetical protein
MLILYQYVMQWWCCAPEIGEPWYESEAEENEGEP